MRSLFRPKDTSPEAAEDKALAERFEGRVRLSWLALLGERIWEALLWPFLVVAAFLVVSLLELWSLLPPLLHRVLLGGFGLAFIVSFVPLLRLVAADAPGGAAAARAERRHQAPARLLLRGSARRHPAQGRRRRSGRAHRERLSRLIAKLKPSWPAPRTDRKDPYAIRAALLLTLVAAMLAAGGNASDRLRSAFSPAASGATALLRLDAWVTPPVYTGIAPIVLADGSEPVGAGAESASALCRCRSAAS